jgi:acetolactate synthase-1/2/3 large subunit
MPLGTPLVKNTAAMSGAHMLLRALEHHGVEYIFGVPGHGAYPVYDAINDFPSIRPIIGRNEQGITFAAVAYAWATGSVAVATSVPGAGLTNASTSLLEATRSQDRVLFLLEKDPAHHGIAQAVAQYYEQVDEADTITDAVHDLWKRLVQGRPGAAILEIANAALRGEATLSSAPDLGAPVSDLPPSALQQAVDVLRTARRVVIAAGASAGSADGGQSIQTIAERLRAPVFTDGFAKGLIAEDHPLALGHSWTAGGPGAELISGADAVLVVGTPLAGAQNESTWDPAMFPNRRSSALPDQHLVLVDWDDAFQSNLPAEIRLRGNVPTILRGLAERMPPRVQPGYAERDLAEIREFALNYARKRIPEALSCFEGIRAALPTDGILLTDSLIGLWLDRLYSAHGPRLVRFPWGTGTLGFGVPGAVGAKLARPTSEVIVVAGDGAFLYNPQELATLLLYKQKVIIVVANDHSYSAIKHNMLENFGRSTSHALCNPDFVTFAEAFGMTAVRLASPDGLEASLRAALSLESSTLIEVPLELKPPRALYDLTFGYLEPDADAVSEADRGLAT